MSQNTYYDVTIIDQARYRLRVVAGYAAEAERIAESIILEEFTRGCPDVTVDERKLTTEVTEDSEKTQAAPQYRGEATYSVHFGMTVPAASADEAKRHIRRLYEANAGPFEFDISDDRLTGLDAWEVQS